MGIEREISWREIYRLIYKNLNNQLTFQDESSVATITGTSYQCVLTIDFDYYQHPAKLHLFYALIRRIIKEA